MKYFRLLVLVLPIFLTACELSPQQKADYSAVESSGVSPAIYDKMIHGDDLSVHDVEALGRSHVNSAIILRYIRDQDSTYFLSMTDVDNLQRAGVDRSVIDYMLQTSRNGYWGGGYGGYGPYGFGYGGGFDDFGPYGFGYDGLYDPFWYPGFGFYGGYGRGYGGYRGGGYHGGGGFHGGGGYHR